MMAKRAHTRRPSDDRMIFSLPLAAKIWLNRYNNCDVRNRDRRDARDRV